MNSEAEKILIVALDNLGDAVMASGIVGPIRKKFPDSKIGFWVKKYAAGLFAGHSKINCLHASDPFWDKSPGLKSGSLMEFLDIYKEVKSINYDVALILNAEWRRSLVTCLMRIPKRVGYARRKSSLFLTQAVPQPLGKNHFVDLHRKLVEGWLGLDVPIEECWPKLALNEEEVQNWKKFSADNSLQDKQFVIFHLFSGDEKKNWPLSQWIKLLDACLAKKPNERVVILCGPGEEEKISDFQPYLMSKEVLLLSSPPLSLLKAVIAHARCLVGGDSGPAHVAGAFDTPLISLFGNTDPEISRPLGRGPRLVLQGASLSSISYETVLDKMKSL